MYSGIAEHYDEIFPPDPAMENLINVIIKNYPLLLTKYGSALDIGCGTGNLTFILEKLFGSVTGIDLDSGMIAIAQKKATSMRKSSVFQNMDMTTISTNFPAASFDLVTCFGNTLVHLANLSQITDFLTQVKKILKPRGLFILQILHYDHIFAQKITELPPIETKDLLFLRNYLPAPDESRIIFETILHLKNGEKNISNRVELFPLRSKQLEKALTETGFSSLKFFGGFDGHPLQENDFVLIAEGTN